VRVVAPAKINLYLWVGPKRTDGLHQVESIMQSVSLFDSLDVSAADAITLDVSPAGSAPEDESNLVVAAVRALRTRCPGPDGAALRLTKEIPSRAGLGGGSTDAAATLIALNELWGCGLSRKALEGIGASIGADVPFCVRGGTAGAIGAGERLSPLVAPTRLSWVIAMPAEELSTAAVYVRFDELGTGRAESDPSRLADALARGDLDQIAASLENDLTAAAVSLAPAVAEAGRAFLDAGALGAVMSGSGPAWCGLGRDDAHAEAIAAAVRSRYPRTWAVRSLDRGAKIVER
jgi:4-diphosphocytidyl-2-C-methyl-D-erythritol kinase